MAEKDFRVILVGGDCPKIKAKQAITQMDKFRLFRCHFKWLYYWNC